MRIVFFESADGIRVSDAALDAPLAVVCADAPPPRGDIVGIGDKQYVVFRSTWIVNGDRMEAGVVLTETIESGAGGTRPLVPYSRRT